MRLPFVFVPAAAFAFAFAVLLGHDVLGRAHAACLCQCVSGRMEAVCGSALDIKPSCIGICAPDIGAPPSAQVPPIAPPGTKFCRIERVCEPAAAGGRCREQQVCR